MTLGDDKSFLRCPLHTGDVAQDVRFGLPGKHIYL